MSQRCDERTQRRVLRFLCHADALMSDGARPHIVLLDAGDRGRIGVARGDLADLVRRGLVVLDGTTLRLSDRGEQTSQASGDAFSPDQTVHEASVVVGADGPHPVTINAQESPLAALWRRRGRDGSRFLTDDEFLAGERLRADYGHGQVMPRLGVNWSAAGASGRKHGGTNGIADLTDTALAARQRVEGALRAVGPELAGLLVDVCCFLKGLERVEAERRWPARSAKVVLKSALAMLARHYTPTARREQRAILHWGAADFRPSMPG